MAQRILKQKTWKFGKRDDWLYIFIEILEQYIPTLICFYNVFPHNRHPIACPLGRGMGCLLQTILSTLRNYIDVRRHEYSYTPIGIESNLNKFQQNTQQQHSSCTVLFSACTIAQLGNPDGYGKYIIRIDKQVITLSQRNQVQQICTAYMYFTRNIPWFGIK